VGTTDASQLSLGAAAWDEPWSIADLAASSVLSDDGGRVMRPPGDEGALLRELTPAIADARTVEDAIELTLREICAYTGWAMGQAWKRNGSPYLESYPCWCAVSDAYRSFRTRSESITFKSGEGLPGSAWSNRRPVWVPDVGSRPDLPRGPFMREVGITAGLAVPVLAQGDVVAVLEFFLTDVHERDEAMIGLVSAAAAQLGALILRRNAEEAVRASEECFRLLINSVEDAAIFKLDPNGEVASWNSGAQRVCGYRPEEITGYHVSRFYAPDAVLDARPELHLEQARANGRFEETGWRVRADGSRFWASVVIAPLYDRAGRLRGFSHVIRDATPERRTQEELHWLRAIVECSDDAIIGLSPEHGIITTWNASAERLFGYPAREVIGRAVSLLVSRDRLARVQEALAEVVETGKVVRYETEALRNNDSRVDVAITASPVRDSHGTVIGISAIARDVTDHKCARRHMERTLGAYLDPDVAGQILNDGVVPAAAEQEVTILFLDIRDFTALAEGIEPQKVMDKLNHFFELAVPLITEHGGQVDKFVGDGLLAVFGMPGSREAHADDALRAALEIDRRMSTELPGQFEIGIGLHTGRVLVGNVGGGGRLDYTVIGDVVNTAARIEGATRRTGDTILFSEQTRDRLTSVEVAMVERPAVHVKGKREPMPMWAILDV
jgi:PAS domain S-box-containing protein